MQCARHPQVETYVRCSKCDQPICPKCMVAGPVGMRCRDCSRQNLDTIMRGTPAQYLLGALGAFGSALALGWMPHLLIWLAIMYGWIVGEATLRGSGRKRGLGMQIMAGLAAAVGTVVWELRGALLSEGLASLAWLASPWTLVGLGLGVFFAVMRVRYI